MTQQDIWAFPDASDLSPRRLINCANLITTLGSDADELRRYVCARDLHEKERSINISSNLTETQTDLIDHHLSSLSPSQQGAFERVYESKHDIVFIQGPPGTGKTTFITTPFQILWHCRYPWIACAPSNSATHHLATVLQRVCPEMGAIRFHAYENETSAIRRQEKALATGNNTEAQDEPEFTDAQAAEDNRLFCDYIAELQKHDLEWKGKLARPNFKDISLHARAMQNAGLVQHELKCFAPTTEDPHAEFRQCLSNRDLTRGKSEDERTRYHRLEDELMADTLRKSGGVITTLSKTADNKLKQAKKPVIAIVDEACQSTELETLLVWAHMLECLDHSPAYSLSFSADCRLLAALHASHVC